LAVVDFDEDDSVGTVVTFQRKRLLEAEELFVKGTRLAEVAHVQRHMRDAQDSSSLHG
jgi:hypothetical protein